MYLYIGQDTVLNTGEIVGIFDLDITSMSRVTKAYLAAAQRSGHVRAVSTELPKSFILCEQEGQIRVYLTHIAPATLKKRAGILVEDGGPK